MKMININIPIKRFLSFAIVASVLLHGCKEDENNKPSLIGDKPEQVTNIEIVSLPGAAEISYKIPKHAVYVVAEYEIRPGIKRDAKSSKYKNSLTIEGFSMEGDFDVKLYAVGEGEVKSDPVIINAKVLKTPIELAFESISIDPDFGGAKFKLTNPGYGDLSIDILTKDESDKLVKAHTFYSSLKDISFSIRGYESENRAFGVMLRDRWGNVTEVIYKDIVPLYEEQVDRRIMSQYTLPTDEVTGHTWGGISPRIMAFMFDGVTTSGNDVFHTLPTSTLPQHFTFTLGKEIKLSRFKLWQRNTVEHTFAGTGVKKFKIYGSINPNMNGSFDSSWKLIGEFEVIKPSGLPLLQLSNEDIVERANGSEFNVPEDIGYVKYIRVEALETWGGLSHITIAEMAFWGTYQ